MAQHTRGTLVLAAVVGLLGPVASAQTVTVGQVIYNQPPQVVPNCNVGGQWIGPWNFQGIINPGLRGSQSTDDDRDWGEITHAILLPPPEDSASSGSRRVLLMCRRQDVGTAFDPYGGDTSPKSFIWDRNDPEDLTELEIRPDKVDGSCDPFCGGHALTRGGHVLWVGGTDEKKQTESGVIWGIKSSYLFVNRVVPSWVYNEVAAEPMQRERWYPSAVRLADGSIIVAGHDKSPTGSSPATHLTRERAVVDDAAKTVRWMSFNSSKLLSNRLGCSGSTLVDLKSYPRLQLLASGLLLSSSEFTYALELGVCSDASNPDGWLSLPTSPTPEAQATVVRFLDLTGTVPVEILYSVGGSVPGTHGLGSKQVLRMEIDQDEPDASVWTSTDVPQLNAGRVYNNTVVLLDGSIVTVGGVSQDPGSGTEVYSRHPERLKPLGVFADPSTGWQYMASQEHERTYHSVAVLLPNGDVFSAGGQGTSVFSEPPDRPFEPVPPWYSVELYRPPYMCSTYRPVIGSNYPATLSVGAVGVNFSVTLQSTSDGGETRVALIAPGAATHAMDSSQAYIQLFHEVTSLNSDPTQPSTIRINAPVSGNHVPPGWYLLTVVNSEGLPSVAKWVKLVGP